MAAASNIFLGIAIVCVLCGVAFALMIGAALQQRGVKINWLWFRVFLVTTYLGQYRDITRRETGRPGALYYAFSVAMMAALLAAAVGLALRAM
jgi:hypothetical protein